MNLRTSVVALSACYFLAVLLAALIDLDFGTVMAIFGLIVLMLGIMVLVATDWD